MKNGKKIKMRLQIQYQGFNGVKNSSFSYCTDAVIDTNVAKSILYILLNKSYDYNYRV